MQGSIKSLCMTLILLDGERKKKSIPQFSFLSILSQISIFNIYDMISSEIIGVVCIQI